MSYARVEEAVPLRFCLRRHSRRFELRVHWDMMGSMRGLPVKVKGVFVPRRELTRRERT